MSLILNGPGRRALREILLEAFTRSKLDRALAEASPAREFSHLVAIGPFEDQVAELIDCAEREGWLTQFERLVLDELPEREDLYGRLKAVLSDAADNAGDIEEDDAPLVILRGRLITLAGVGTVLGLIGAVLGLLAFKGDELIGKWSLVLAVFALLLGIVYAVLLVGAFSRDRIADRTIALLRSKLPAVGLAVLSAVIIFNGFAMWQFSHNKRPNFILKVIDRSGDDAVVVANQSVHLHELVNPGEDERPVERITDGNGEAFFKLRLGTGILYSGGIAITEEDGWRNCTFPAFPALEARSVLQNVAALNCLKGSGTERSLLSASSGLRVVQDFASSGLLPASIRDALPVDSVARARRAPLGVPAAPLGLDRLYYSLGYDPSRRVPLWAAFTLETQREFSGRNLGVSFEPDPDLPPQFQSSSADYRNNPYDQGHLVSSTDARSYGLQADREAFYYSAVVPQAKETNRGVWAELEKFSRELANHVGPIHVICGPIYERNRILVMGPGETLVPIAFYRVLLRQTTGGQWRAVAFIVDNDGSVARFDPNLYIVSVNEIEVRSGLKFFPDSQPDQALRLKSNIDIQLFLADS